MNNLQALRERVEKATRDILPSDEILARIPDNEIIILMRQNPADNYHWSKRLSAVSGADLRLIAALLNALENANG